MGYKWVLLSQQLEGCDGTLWYDVGIVRNTMCTVQGYYSPSPSRGYVDEQGEPKEQMPSAQEIK